MKLSNKALEATDRRGFAAWDESGHFLGCFAYERGLAARSATKLDAASVAEAGSVWAPVHTEAPRSRNSLGRGSRQELLPPERLSLMDHCRLPLDYHFPADFPHVTLGNTPNVGSARYSKWPLRLGAFFDH